MAGHTVRAMTQYNSMGSAGWLDKSSLRDEMEIIQGDVRDAEWCSKVTSGVDYVFHLAALIAVPFSFKAPRSYIETNVIGTLNMCQASIQSGLAKFIQMSTSEVYGSAQHIPIAEGHPVSPQSPYAASKVGADAVARSAHCSFGLPLCIGRPFNTFGPRQSRRAFIPTVLSQILSGQDEIRIGNTKPSRDLTFVRDTSRALLLLAEKGPSDASVVNIGTGLEFTVSEVIEKIQRLLGTNLPVVQEESRIRPMSSEVDRLVCNNERLRSLTGFVPETSLEEGLNMTIEWMQDDGATYSEWNSYAL